MRATVDWPPNVDRPLVKPAALKSSCTTNSPFFRNLTVPFLTSAGHHVTAVDGAREALKLLTQDTKGFDLVVTDIEMPEMNGFEFAKTCRTMPQLKGLPIVAYTSSLGEDVVRRGREAAQVANWLGSMKNNTKAVSVVINPR